VDEPRYRFLTKLGEGGMGEVYLVEHLQLGRKEALKVLRANLARDERFVLRFRREARATHRVQHPNIVAVHDFGRLGDGRFFLAMEYVEGTRLDVVLEQTTTFAIPRALDRMVQLSGAVAHAHRHGVIHRDLKPANLLLSDARGGEVLKVLDFGIAKLMFPEAGDETQLTLDGEVFGTPKYMAPELFIAGQPIDHRADIYAMGCIAYELLTGQPPFNGRRMEVIDGHLGKQPEPIRARNPAVPPELERLITRCLEKNPSKRLSSAHDLHLALELLAGGKPGPRIRRTSADTDPPEAEPGTDVGDETEAAASGRYTYVPQQELARAEEQAAIHAAAEEVLALGHSGTDLVFLLVDVKEVGHARDKILAEQRDVEERMAAAEQTAREREAALRFAMAELVFDQQADPKAKPSDPMQLRRLEAKLVAAATDHEREVAALTERAIHLAGELGAAEERRTALFAALGEAVDQALARFRGEPALAAMRERLRKSRSPR
jgi:serine/threonine-protein kinase